MKRIVNFVKTASVKKLALSIVAFEIAWFILLMGIIMVGSYLGVFAAPLDTPPKFPLFYAVIIIPLLENFIFYMIPVGVYFLILYFLKIRKNRSVIIFFFISYLAILFAHIFINDYGLKGYAIFISFALLPMSVFFYLLYYYRGIKIAYWLSVLSHSVWNIIIFTLNHTS